MRKICFINTLIAASLMTAGLAQAATTTVNGGTIHFRGEVVNAACAVDAGSVDQTVLLGQVKASKINADGHSDSTPFTIQLNDCDTSVSTKASIGFTGVTVDAANTKALALESSAAGGASNVAVQVLDHTGAAVAFDGSASASSTLIDGTNKIPFQAQYIKTGTAAATAGTANANANFNVQYE